MLQRIKYRLASTSTSIHRRLFAVINKGNDVNCPICHWKGRQFYGKSALCPQCKAMPRHRLISFAFEYFRIPVHNTTFLLAGPGPMEFSWAMHQIDNGVYIGLDLLKRQAVTLCGDLTQLPLDSDSIDVFFAWHVLEHIRQDIQAIAEVYRVLKPGGKAIISVPIYPPGRAETFQDDNIPKEMYLEVYGHEDHVRSCGLDYYKRWEAAGFSVTQLHVEQLLHSPYAEQCKKYGLSAAHIAWNCTKGLKTKISL